MAPGEACSLPYEYVSKISIPQWQPCLENHWPSHTARVIRPVKTQTHLYKQELKPGSDLNEQFKEHIEPRLSL